LGQGFLAIKPSIAEIAAKLSDKAILNGSGGAQRFALPSKDRCGRSAADSFFQSLPG